jgi:hypothetical protein
VLTQVSLNTWLSRGDATLFHGYFDYGDLFTLSWHLRLLDPLDWLGNLTRRRNVGWELNGRNGVAGSVCTVSLMSPRYCIGGSLLELSFDIIKIVL